MYIEERKKSREEKKRETKWKRVEKKKQKKKPEAKREIERKWWETVKRKAGSSKVGGKRKIVESEDEVEEVEFQRGEE